MLMVQHPLIGPGEADGHPSLKKAADKAYTLLPHLAPNPLRG